MKYLMYLVLSFLLGALATTWVCDQFMQDYYEAVDEFRHEVMAVNDSLQTKVVKLESFISTMKEHGVFDHIGHVEDVHICWHSIYQANPEIREKHEEIQN